ncbi:MAG: cysteine hydrolase family protein [Pseudomonadota bacterium]
MTPNQLLEPIRAGACGLALLAMITGAAGATPPPPTLRELGGAVHPRLDPAKAALIIIDAQMEYAHGPLAVEKLEPAVDEIVRLRAWAQAVGAPVIHIQQVGRPGGPIFAADGPGVRFLPDLAPAAGEIVVKKTRPNSFARTELDAVLQRLGRRQVILTGFMTHMCVDSTARAAFDLDYDAFVVASATADRPLPRPEGGLLSAADVRRATLTALGDRFVTVLPDAAAVVTPAPVMMSPTR